MAAQSNSKREKGIIQGWGREGGKWGRKETRKEGGNEIRIG